MPLAGARARTVASYEPTLMVLLGPYTHGQSIKRGHVKIYDALRKRGMSKSQGAAVANSTTPARRRKKG